MLLMICGVDDGDGDAGVGGDTVVINEDGRNCGSYVLITCAKAAACSAACDGANCSDTEPANTVRG